MSSRRKVRIDEGPPTVKEIDLWPNAHLEARKGGYWEQIGRDRERFSRRIQTVGQILSPILTADHRKNIVQIIYGCHRHDVAQLQAVSVEKVTEAM